MSNLIRLFTCAGVVALAGFSATTSMLACSSDPAPAPSGDDTDDDDAGTQTSTSSSSSSTSSSASSSSGATGAPCVSEPGGTYALAKAAYKAAGGKVCDNFATGGNANAKPSEVTFTKDAEGSSGVSGQHYTMTIPGNADYKIVLLFDEETCQLAGGEPPTSYVVGDGNGNDISAKTSPSHVFEFHDEDVKQQTLIQVESDPAGAPGTPCSFTVTATGTKK